MEQEKNVSKEELKFAYEQSISAYQKHVERYNTRMNMYAIMTGALFVAFYSIYGKDSTCIICGKLNEICNCSLVSDDNTIFLLLIAILGFICSLCWYGAVKGHYEWMKSFIKIVKFNEKKCFGENGPFVYSKVIASKSAKPHDENENYLCGFFSTQKITLFFIKGVFLAWLGGIIILLFKNIYVSIIAFVLFLVLLMLDKDEKIVESIPERFHSTISSNEVITNNIKL